MFDILITDGHQRKTLSAIRSLGKRGLKIACSEGTRMNPSGFSRYCAKFIRTPVPGKREEEFMERLREIITGENIKVLLPMDDFTTQLAVENSDELSKYCDFALPGALAFNTARDKLKAFRHAQASGLRCPRSAPERLRNETFPDISGLKFPLIIKPRESSGSRGIRVTLNETEFNNEYSRIALKYPDPLVQEYIEISSKIDVCLMYNKQSELKAAFVQRELRNFPYPLGPSTVQEGIIDKYALSLAVKFMEGLEWTGPAELEFVIDATSGEYIFMEINPRFWASLELSIRSGVDFPYMYYLIARDGDCPLSDGYVPGIKTRWVFPGEILAFLEKNKKKNDPLPFFFTRKCDIINDTFDPKDIMPSFGLLMSALYHMADKKRRNSILRR